jgi:hypothetical protein
VQKQGCPEKQKFGSLMSVGASSFVEHPISGRIIICGTPDAEGKNGPRTRRDWLANLKANPEFLFCLKESLTIQLPARAVPIVDREARRQLMNAPETKWYRQQVDSVEDLIEASPIVEVFFKDFTYTE